MNRYHFRIFTGPTAVKQIAERLTAAAMPWQHVTIEGTEHLHYSIDALHVDAAERESQTWAVRAGFSPQFANLRALLRTEALSDECPKCSKIGAGTLCKAHRADYVGAGAFSDIEAFVRNHYRGADALLTGLSIAGRALELIEPLTEAADHLDIARARQTIEALLRHRHNELNPNRE